MQHITHNSYLRRLYRLASRSLYFPPLVVLVAILTITIWPWQNARHNLQNSTQQIIDSRIKVVEDSLSARFTTYNNSLQSGVSLLQASPQISKDQWNTFYASSERTVEGSVIQGIGYVKVFPSSQLNSVQAFMHAQGATDFNVHPLEPARSTYSSLLYLYSPTSVNPSSIGVDMLTNPQRKLAMDRAAASGLPSLTQKVTPLLESPSSTNQSFLLFVPYFDPGTEKLAAPDRQTHLQGFVYAGFRAQKLFNQIVEPISQSQHYSVKIYDTAINPNNLLYQTTNSDQISSKNHAQVVTTPAVMFGTTWQFQFSFERSSLMSRSERNAPLYILLVGAVTAMIVFLALVSIFKSRARELQQQKDKEVNLAKDELLSLASHQMRTPATGVKQYLGMVLQGFAGDIDASQKALLEKAYTSNERQLQVINQILHLAKLESGRIVLAKHQTNLNELIADIADEQKSDITARGHKLKLQLSKKSISEKVDSHMLRMVIENILSNAIKYTIEPGTLIIKLNQTANHVKISVKDTGIGIDQRYFSQIFKQFTRLYDERSERVSGTGVGLYLADQLVKLHGGTLTVQSIVGEGSEFIISLPKTSHRKQ